MTSNELAGQTTTSGSRLGALRLVQFTLWALGAIVLAWGVVDPRFRNAEGFPSALVGLPVAASLALFVAGWAVAARLRQFAFWFGVSLVGQAIALQLIDAGTGIHYQHYQTLAQLSSGLNLWLALGLLLQIGVVVWGLSKRWAGVRRWLSRSRPWQIVAIAIVLVLPSAALSRDVPAYVVEVVLASLVEVASLGAVALMVWSLPEGAVESLRSKLDTIFGAENAAVESARPGVDRLVLALAVWVTVVAAALALFSYQAHPHVQDEVAYLYQARFLADGAITLPAPPVPQAFDFYLMEFKGSQWYPSTPFGWPAVLAVGVFLGVPWLVDPVLAGISVLLTFVLIRELYDRRTARLAVLLLAISPWFLFMAMNYMTHTVTLTCALAAAVFVAWSRKSGSIGWAFAAGAMIGLGSLIRPLDGLLTGLFIGLWAIGVGGKRLRAPAIVALIVGTALVGGLVLPYNQMLTGKASVFPLNAYLDEHFGAGRNDLGFGANRGYGWALQPFPGHSPLGALVNTELNAFSLNIELFGWGIGSFLLIGVLLISRQMRRTDYLMLGIIGITVGTFALYWYSGGPDFGARYWYLILIPCIALTVRGVQALQKWFESGANATRILVAVLALCLFTVVNYLPWRALDKYHDYLGMRPDILSLAQEYHFGKSLVLIQGQSTPDYESAAIYNPLDWNADAPVYAWAVNSQVTAQVVQAFPDRTVWVVAGPSITQHGFQVVAGPMSGAQVLAQVKDAP